MRTSKIFVGACRHAQCRQWQLARHYFTKGGRLHRLECVAARKDAIWSTPEGIWRRVAFKKKPFWLMSANCNAALNCQTRQLALTLLKKILAFATNSLPIKQDSRRQTCSKKPRVRPAKEPLAVSSLSSLVASCYCLSISFSYVYLFSDGLSLFASAWFTTLRLCSFIVPIHHTPVYCRSLTVFFL